MVNLFNIHVKRPTFNTELTKKIGDAVQCHYCKSNDSVFWRKLDNNTICASCFSNPSRRIQNNIEKNNNDDNDNTEKDIVEDDSNSQASSNDDETNTDVAVKEPRKKVVKMSKPRFKKSNKPRSRHALFKNKNPTETSTQMAMMTVPESLYHKGCYYAIGDVVSCVDEVDGLKYYAVIRGFLCDKFSGKAVVVTWLLPTHDADEHRDTFDIHSYIPGPSEETPRNLNEFMFVCHSNYEENHQQKNSFVWGVSKQICKAQSIDTSIFGQ